MRKRRIIFISLAIVGLMGVVAYPSIQNFKEFTFNEDGALTEWEKMILNKEVDYVLTTIGGEGHVQALSEKACSAIFHRVKYDLKDYPYLKWRWKILRFPDVSQAVTAKEKDDYAARVYVIFPSWVFTSYQFLEYVWSEDIPEGTITKSPYGNNIRVIVVRSGEPTQEELVSEVRNVYDDYKNAFGKEARRKVGAVAFMCDADGTNTMAKSLVDDIAIAKQK
ncbi:DUF3047 domain-containing protein [Candidatus Omnitrophota bacterium]